MKLLPALAFVPRAGTILHTHFQLGRLESLTNRGALGASSLLNPLISLNVHEHQTMNSSSNF